MLRIQIQPIRRPVRNQDNRQLQLCVPLMPSCDVTYQGLEIFIWLEDVPEELGPAHMVPLSLAAGAPAVPHGYLRSEWPALCQSEVSAVGPAGTVVAYNTDTFHRGTQVTAPGSAGQRSRQLPARGEPVDQPLFLGRPVLHRRMGALRRASLGPPATAIRLPAAGPPRTGRARHWPGWPPDSRTWISRPGATHPAELLTA